MKKFIFLSFWILLYVAYNLDLAEVVAFASILILLTVNLQYEEFKKYIVKESEGIDEVDNYYNQHK